MLQIIKKIGARMETTKELTLSNRKDKSLSFVYQKLYG